jgi:hypothetical protein
MEILIELSEDETNDLISKQFISSLPKDWDNIAVRQPDLECEYRYKFKINHSCWHPAINSFGYIVGTSIDDCIRQFYDPDYACRCPYNIDAAVLWKRDKLKFAKINDELIGSIGTNCKYCDKIIDISLYPHFECIKDDCFQSR